MYQTGLAGPGAAGPARADRPADLTDRQLMVRVTSPQARCANDGADADDWFPVATRAEPGPRRGGPGAGVVRDVPGTFRLPGAVHAAVGRRRALWRRGGLLEAERAAIRKEWLSGVSVSRLLDTRTAEASQLDPRNPSPAS